MTSGLDDSVVLSICFFFLQQHMIMIVIMIQNANKDKPIYKYWKNLSGSAWIIMKLIEGSSVLKIVALGVAEQGGYRERDAEHVGEGDFDGD